MGPTKAQLVDKLNSKMIAQQCASKIYAVGGMIGLWLPRCFQRCHGGGALLGLDLPRQLRVASEQLE